MVNYCNIISKTALIVIIKYPLQLKDFRFLNEKYIFPCSFQ